MSTSAQSATLVPRAAFTAGETKVHAQKTAKKGLAKRGIGIGAALVLAVWLGLIGLDAFRYAKTDNAYVVGRLHQVSTQVDGRVQRVLIRENQVVKTGDLLLELDAQPFQIALDKAEAAVAQARAGEDQAAAAESSAAAKRVEAAARIAQTDAQINQARAQLDLSQTALARAEKLMQAGGISTQAELDTTRSLQLTAQAALDAATADNAAARAAATSADAAVSAAKSQVSAAHAATAAATADLAEARRRLSETRLLAPADGRIGNRNVEAGNRVQAGQPLFALAEDDDWIVANFKETDVGRFTTGEDATLTIDALPGLQLHGTIESISPASGAQFALLPPDNATGNFTKVVQRVPVKIVLDDASRQLAADVLRLGYSAVVRIRIR